jgi:glycosyltransferase involved in cell wall biosynthesis
MIRVVQVVPRIADTSSGPSVSVPSLCCALAQESVETQLIALEPRPQKMLFDHCEFLPASRLPFAHRLGASAAMKHALTVAAKQTGVIHTNSLWMMPNIYPASAVRGTNCKLMISPRGTLSPWALKRSRLRKRLMWYLGQRSALRAATCFHATSHEEVRQIRELGFSQPIAEVPNGVCCPDGIALQRDPARSHRVLLFLARIHPTKGVDLLLNEWRELSQKFPDWILRIAGPLNNSHAQQMMQLADRLSLKRVEFLGEVTGESKSQTYQDADLYVLPTHSENFGISVAEALAHGLPAVVFEGAPWSGLNCHDAGWWIEHGASPLRETLQSAMSAGDEQRDKMGQNGRRWMQREFDWPIIGQRMAGVYRWLVNGGPCPSDVMTKGMDE